MGGPAPNVVIRTGVLEKPLDSIRVRLLDGARSREAVLERRPSGYAMLQRERVLDVAQRGDFWGVGKGSCETSAGVGNVRAKRFQPALRFPLQVLEGALGRDLPGHDTFLPLLPEVR